jgi:hypothetical protein
MFVAGSSPIDTWVERLIGGIAGEKCGNAWNPSGHNIP